MGALTDEEIATRLGELPSWSLRPATEGRAMAIHKEFVFANFPAAVAFVGRLVPHAEKVDHHPDVDIRYRRVTVAYTTHSAGRLTAKDFDGATVVDRLATEEAV